MTTTTISVDHNRSTSTSTATNTNTNNHNHNHTIQKNTTNSNNSKSDTNKTSPSGSSDKMSPRPEGDRVFLNSFEHQQEQQPQQQRQQQPQQQRQPQRQPQRQQRQQQWKQQRQQQWQQQQQQQQQIQQQSAKNGHEIEFHHVHGNGNGNGNSHGFDHQDNTSMSQYSSPSNTNTSNDANTASVSASANVSAIASTNNSNSISNNNSIGNSRHVRNNSNASITSANNDPMGRSSHRNSLIYFSMDMDDVIDTDDNSDGQDDSHGHGHDHDHGQDDSHDDGHDENHDFDDFGGPSRSYSRETSNTVIEEEDEDEDDFQEAIENNDDEDEDDDHNNYNHNGNGNSNGNGNYGNGHNDNNFKNDNVNEKNNNNAGNMNIHNNDYYYKENGQTQMMMNNSRHNNTHNHVKEILDIDQSQVRYNNDEVDSLQRQQQQKEQQQQEWQQWQEWQQQQQQQYNNVNNNDSSIVEDHDKRGIVGEQSPNYNTKNDRAKRLSIKSSNSNNSPNNRSSNSNSNIQQQKLVNVKDPIAVIQTTNSNAPILIFDPEQQLDDHIDIDINNNEDQSSKSSISTNSNSNSDSNSATYTQESQDFNERHDSHNNNNTNINTNNTRRSNIRQKSSSALDNLVEAASRPTFKRMESDTVLVDPETPPPLIDNKLRNVHDLEYDGDNDHDDHGDNNVNGVGYGENQSYDTATTSSSLNQHHQQHRQQHRQRRNRRHRENNNDNTHANEIDHDQQLQQRRRHFQQQKRNISSNSQGSSICSSNSSSNRNNRSNRRLKRSSLKHKKNDQNANSSSLSNNSSSHGSSSCSISSHTSFSSQRYQIKNTDTGKTYDIRDLEIVKSDDDEEILQVKYSLFPSKYDLMERHNKRNDSDDEDSKLGSTSFSPLKDTRIGKSSMKAVSKTGRAVAKASQNISKGFLKRSKSEGAPLSSSLQFGPLLEPFPKEDMGETNRFDAKMKSTLQRNEGTDEVAHKVEGDETKASKVHDNIDLTDSVKSTAKSQNQQQKSKRKKRNAKATPLGIPKNTLPVKCVNKSKSQSDFNPLLLISTLANAHDGPIWRASFCKDGEYLATAGSDGVLNIWKIAPTREQVQDLKTKESLNEPDSVWKGHWDEDAENNEDNALPTAKSESDAIATEVKFILPQPIQTFKEHTQDITDISWSNTGFLLSASFDNTVRLWHPTMSKSLHLFRHPDPVTSVSFDPNQDRYFLSGGFDKKIRIWDITNGRVVEWAQASHIITTATYQPDGTKIAAGLLDGKVIFYSVEGIKLKYFTEILCKNKRKKYGKKVTGLTFPDSEDKVDNDDDDSSQKKKTKLKKAATMVRNFGRKKKKIKQQVLITSNDSRLRLVGLNDFCMIRKYKGHHNPDVMMKARFSESGKFIIVGSEKTGKVTIWNTETRRNPLNVNITGLNMYDKMKEYECFDASKASQGIAFPIVTEALFAKTVSAKRAILNCGLFPSLWTLDHINHDFSSAIIVSCDYGGTIRIFLRQASFDAVVHASGPMGYTESNS